MNLTDKLTALKSKKADKKYTNIAVLKESKDKLTTIAEEFGLTIIAVSQIAIDEFAQRLANEKLFQVKPVQVPMPTNDTLFDQRGPHHKD